MTTWEEEHPSQNKIYSMGATDWWELLAEQRLKLLIGALEESSCPDDCASMRMGCGAGPCNCWRGMVLEFNKG